MPCKQAKVVTTPMLKRMLRRVSHSTFPARDRAMILLSVKAGLRACEIAGLDWSMVPDAQGRLPCPGRAVAARNIRSGLRDVQFLAGHRSIETTERYIDGDTCAQRRLVGYV